MVRMLKPAHSVFMSLDRLSELAETDSWPYKMSEVAVRLVKVGKLSEVLLFLLLLKVSLNQIQIYKNEKCVS